MTLFPKAPLLAVALLSLGGCAGEMPAARAPEAHGLVRAGTPDDVNIARSRAGAATVAFTWQPFGPEAFARAAREHKPLLLDGAAAWCHWCHVMDETTYKDPEIGRILREKVIAVRVDIDEHPDIAERYGDWGWPATILFSPDAREIGKYRGYLPAADLRQILDDLEKAAAAPEERDKPAPGLTTAPPPVAALPVVAGFALLQLDDYYDRKEGGWGQRQKSPLGANILVELGRAARGDEEAKKRALFTLDKQRALIDPVWGGVYQYSAGATWSAPHYEKLMPYQAANLEAYAAGYAISKDPKLLADAEHIARYLDTFLSSAEGAFLVSQDADVGSHDDQALFVDGDVYYRRSDEERRKLGIPRVDDHVYGHENGLAISAFSALFEASGDRTKLDRARRAADLMLKTLVLPDGAVKRGSGSARYLADAAGLGRGLANLARVTGEASYREAAVRIAAAMDRDFADPASGGLFDRTDDPAAAGVFARRRMSFGPNILAARSLAALGRLTGEEGYRARGRAIVAASASPRAVQDQGRMVGELLLALEELGASAAKP